MKLSLKFKLGTLLVVMLLAIFTIVGAVQWVSEMQKADGMVINVAGRQRMLSQKFAKEVLAELEVSSAVSSPATGPSMVTVLPGREGTGNDAGGLSGNREGGGGGTESPISEDKSYYKTYKLFEVSLRALREGGETFTSLDMAPDSRIAIPGTENPEILELFSQIESDWDELISLASVAGAGSADPASRREVIQGIVSQSNRVLKNMHKAVGLFTADSNRKQQMLNRICGIASVGGVAIFVLAWLLVGRGVIRPLHLVGSALERIQQGALDTRVRLNSRDEIGDLARVTNRMAEQLEASFSESSRLARMIEDIPTNVMVADTDLNITYINTASRKTLSSIQGALPCDPDEVVGQSIDVFHSRPEVARKILADPENNLPHQAVITIGDEKISLLVTAVRDGSGNYIGPMITWSVVTTQKDVENQLTLTAESLKACSESLNEISVQIASAAEETSNQAQAVSSATEQVNANMSTVASSAEEMTASIKEISSNSSQAAKVANEAVEVATATHAAITELGKSSQEIGDVIAVIRTIAHQTNLLALNATIEAARAGEAGKGFAVVANEVKELAKQTGEATQEITAKIQSIQQSSEESVIAIDSICQIIGQISDISNTIASAVEEQATTTNEITRNVSESARGTQEIAQNITGVATAASETSKDTQRNLEAAEKLDQLASDLNLLLNRLKQETEVIR